MGDIADQLIEDEMFGTNDEHYYSAWDNRRIANKHLTSSERKIASIRKEIAILVNEQAISLQEARKLINIKYGKGWRDRGLVSNSDNQWTVEDLKPFNKLKNKPNN